MCFAHFSSQSMTRLFILTVFFKKHNLKNFNEVKFTEYFFPLMNCAFVFYLSNLHLTKGLSDFLLFSSKTFIVLGFSFSSPSHFS